VPTLDRCRATAVNANSRSLRSTTDAGSNRLHDLQHLVVG
jgi:hypothetical protein